MYGTRFWLVNQTFRQFSDIFDRLTDTFITQYYGFRTSQSTSFESKPSCFDPVAIALNFKWSNWIRFYDFWILTGSKWLNMYCYFIRKRSKVSYIVVESFVSILLRPSGRTTFQTSPASNRARWSDSLRSLPVPLSRCAELEKGVAGHPWTP